MSNILTNIAAKVESGEIEAVAQDERDTMTAYAVTGLLNQAIAAFHLVDKNGQPHPLVQPQYVYNLARGGAIDGERGNVTGRRYSRELVEKFVTRWVARRLPESLDETTVEQEVDGAEVERQDTDETK